MGRLVRRFFEDFLQELNLFVKWEQGGDQWSRIEVRQSEDEDDRGLATLPSLARSSLHTLIDGDAALSPFKKWRGLLQCTFYSTIFILHTKSDDYSLLH